MNEIKLFEGNEVKVKTDEGNTLINLVHVAKCCSLVREDRGYTKIRWIDIKNKLKEVLSRKYNKTISGKSTEYDIAKNKIFSEFNVTKWEEIPVCKYNKVFAFIEEVI